MARFVKVDLTQEECEAVHTLAELAGTMMAELGHTITAQQRETLKLRLNTVRYKMGAAATLFENGGRNIITPNMLPLDVAVRNKKQN